MIIYNFQFGLEIGVGFGGLDSNIYLIMEQEGKLWTDVEHTYEELASLLVLFLHSPSPDVEHRLTRFPPQLYLKLILNPSQPKQTRQACCASFKAQLNNNNLFFFHANATIQQVQTAYLTSDQRVLADIQGAFEIIVEKLFERYLDDGKKLDAFAGIMQRVSNNSDIRTVKSSLRGLKLAFLILRSMDCTTFNNQVCIGELICYYKQIYYAKHATSDVNCTNGRGLELLREAMDREQCEEKLAIFVDVQVEIAKLIKEILERLEQQEVQDGDSIPASYIRNSGEIDNLFQAILSVNTQGCIYGRNKQVNQLKANLISIYLQQYPYHVSEPFLIVCLSTISRCQPASVIDDVQVIVAAVLQLLERSTNHGLYANYYYNTTQVIVMKLLQLASIREAEREAAENDPQYFVEISNDFCTNQESDSVKIRAGSLLYNLSLTIDGNLTFIANMLMIPLFALQKQLQERIDPQAAIRPICHQAEKGMPMVLQTWGRSSQQLTQVCLLCLCCISDLIIKRSQFHSGIREHLSTILPLFSYREKILEIVPPIIISRYIQIYSFYSFPGCLDKFLPYYLAKPLYAESLLKGLETIMHFHQKKNEQMRNYVAVLSTRLLLLCEKLTPLLQKTILQKPELILCIKQKLVQKLVLWFLDYFDKQNIFGCNKISNLLCKAIEHYPKYIPNDQSLQSYELDALGQYLSPLYKQIARARLHPAEECVIDVAVQHLECVGVKITSELLRELVEMGVVVVEHNGLVLNKCLELFSRTLSMTGMERCKEKMEFLHVRNLQIETSKYLLEKVIQWLPKVAERDSDRWQLLYLLEITLVTLLSESPLLQGLDMDILKTFYSTGGEIVRIKTQSVWMLIMQINRDDSNQAGRCLQSSPLPEKLPPFEKNNFTIYMMGVLPLIKNMQYQIYLLRSILKMFYPSAKFKKYLVDYESLLHCSSQTTQAEIYAFQTVQTVLHPLNALGTDTYKQFRVMYQTIGNWAQLISLLAEGEPELIREIMGQEMVGAKPRKILHVKK